MGYVSPPALALTALRAFGSSSSGTAGTVMASVEAASGSKLIGWVAMARADADASGIVSLKVTYEDDTTETLGMDGGPSVVRYLGIATPASVGRIAATMSGSTPSTSAGGSMQQITGTAAKNVKKLEVITATASTASRTGAIYALQVPA